MPSPEQTLQHMTSPESVTDPRPCWSLFSFHYALSSPEACIFLPAPPQGCSSAGPASPSRRAEGSWQHFAACKAGAASWLSSLCPDKASPTDSRFGEKDCTQHSGTDITTSLNKLLICDSTFTPQICFQSLLCLSSCFALPQLWQATLSAAFRY